MRHFELFELAPSDAPYGSVIAANRAAPHVIAQLLGWAEQSLQERH